MSTYTRYELDTEQLKKRIATKEECIIRCDQATQTVNILPYPIMPALCRTATSRIKLLLLGIFILGVYLINVEPPPAISEPQEFLINVEELEQELEAATRKRDVEFESPFNDEFFYGKTNITKKRRLDLKGVVKKTVDLKGISKKREVIRKVEEKITGKYNELWTWADRIISRQELFPEDERIDTILDALGTAVIVHVDILGHDEKYESGTSEKLLLTLEGGQKALMKINWEEMGKMKKGGLCNIGYEMPGSEIAGFHLHRILGFRNTPYVTGRKIDIAKELVPVATPQVMKHIKQEPGKNACVTGKCYFCDEDQELCPEKGIVDASVAFWIPRPLKLYTYPPGYMPYSTPRMEEWQKYGFNNKTYCTKLRGQHPYQRDWFYYDLFDFSVLDTLMYHYDSKHYVIYDDSPARGLTVRLDHGRAFCASDRDDEHIFLAPLIQCCTLRKSTYEKLRALKHGNILSRRLKDALSKDTLAPVLHEVWFNVLERRLNTILGIVDRCVKANGGLEKVLVSD